MKLFYTVIAKDFIFSKSVSLLNHLISYSLVTTGLSSSIFYLSASDFGLETQAVRYLTTVSENY